MGDDSRCLVLFSGGQDSTTCLYWAKQHFTNVECVAFDYGQRHAVELQQARKIADLAAVRLDVQSLAGLLANSALTEKDRPLTGAHPNQADLPASFVPARNLLMLAVAGGIAYNRGIFDLVAGVCQTDYSGYPDCRRVFIDSMEQTLRLALAPTVFRIHTPLMDRDKADTFRLAEELGVLEIVLEHSHTDYAGNRSQRHEWGYGTLDNEASRLRARGWEEYKRRYRAG